MCYQPVRVTLRLLLTLSFTVAAARGRAAEEPAETDPQDRASAERLSLMRELVQQLVVRPRGDDEETDLVLREEPIFRYNDPARGLDDATVWRLGETGRAHALVMIELRPQQDRYMASYEFLAVEPPAFRARFRQFDWEPPEGVAEFQPIPEAPPPGDTLRARLTQMKQLARRFAAHQSLHGMTNRLRMLPQPIDRYEPSDDPHADGAAFAFTFGVNPEVLLLIETDGASWTCAFARMSTANLVVELDGEPAWRAASTGVPEYQNSTEPYTQSRQYVPLPAAESE